MPADKTTSTPPQGTGKSKKHKKKKAAGKSQANGEIGKSSQEEGQGTAANCDKPSDPQVESSTLANGIQAKNTEPIPETTDDEGDDAVRDLETKDPNAGDSSSEKQPEALLPAPSEPDSRFDALVRDRDSLRVEVTEMRRTLEEIQSKHHGEMESIQDKLKESHIEKNNAETQYRNLLGKVNTIKAQLGERLKADAEELGHARSKIEDLEAQNAGLVSEMEVKSAHIKTLEDEASQRSKEISGLRNRTNLSQQNWLKEKEELVEQEASLRAEFEKAQQAMHEWEILAMEERSIREGFADKVTDLEEQLSSLKIEYEKVSDQSRSQEITVEGLQRALQEIQTARKRELRELVESSDSQAEELRRKLQSAEKSASDAKAELEKANADLERALPFEKEVKEKNLLIGKLRHEAVTLNEHLTKALRFLKKGRPEDNVDRNLVTNHFLHFLALDRSDPKKFQVLQLIAALLGWTDEQREQAGLARPGSTSSLRVPGSSPVHRTPSSPALNPDLFSDSTASRKESLAELWSNFLEQESQAKTEG